MTDIKYYTSKSINDILEFLDNKDDCTILAGGTDIMPKLNYYKLQPKNIVFIGNLGLDYIKPEENRIKIGAFCKLSDIIKNPVISDNIPILKQAIQQMGSMSIRNAATIGGNLCNASPAADTALPLIILNAELTLKSSKQERKVKVENFFVGPGETVLKPNEILTEIDVPVCRGKAVFKKLGRRKSETISVVNTSARVEIEDGFCKDVAIAIGAVAPKPLKCAEAEALLKNKRISSDIINEVVDAVIKIISPVDDQRSTKWYRERAARVLMTRTLCEACNFKPEMEEFK